MATYWVKSGTGGTDAGTSWANAAESIAGLMTAQALAGGDIIYVHNTHSYAAGAAITWTLPETGAGIVYVLCVNGGDATGTSLVDGTVGSLTTGAIEETNGNFTFNVNGPTNVDAFIYCYGIHFRVGSAASQASAIVSLGNGTFGGGVFENCTFTVNSTSSSAATRFGTTSGSTVGRFWLRNCVFSFLNAGNSIALQGGRLHFLNCDISGTSPTTLFIPASQAKAQVYCSGCDWAGPTNIITQVNACDVDFRANNCVIGTPVTGSTAGRGSMTAEFRACSDATSEDILSYYYEDAYGVVEDDQTVHLTTGGAQGEQGSGTDTSYSLKMTPNAKVDKATPLYSPWVSVLVASTGSKAISLKVAHTEAAVLKDNEIWLELEYMGGGNVATSPDSEIVIDAPVVTSTIFFDITAAGSNRTDTAEAWTNIASEKTHTLSKTVTIDYQGYIRCRVALAKDTTNPVYVDPKIGVA